MVPGLRRIACEHAAWESRGHTLQSPFRATYGDQTIDRGEYDAECFVSLVRALHKVEAISGATHRVH
jgi:hypothetical protein